MRWSRNEGLRYSRIRRRFCLCMKQISLEAGSMLKTLHVRTSEYAEVNDKLYEWYLLACFKNIFPGGPQLIEKAKQIAERLGKSDFKVSNGWLEK